MQPPEEMEVMGYTLPVEKTTKLAPLNRRVTRVGKEVFMAQVGLASSPVPNFRPAI